MRVGLWIEHGCVRVAVHDDGEVGVRYLSGIACVERQQAELKEGQGLTPNAVFG